MYIHHILSLNTEETVRKIYEKHKKGHLKGDWIELLKSDFEFMEIDCDEEEIKRTPKSIYKKKIKALITYGKTIMSNGRKTCICSICGKEVQGGHIRTHIEAIHFDGITIQCKICDRIFKSRNSFELHKF